MEIDQSFVSSLPIQQRQKYCRQIRQKQIEKYVENERKLKGTENKKERKKNKKGTAVHFKANYLLQDAIDNFDDREVLQQLTVGGSCNFSTGNGTTLLHRCAAEDNASAAELLLSKGADVNAVDDDWWTPLHMACSCDSVEVLQLLLNNGADPTAVDVDGYFPIDQANEGSEAKQIMSRHLEALGLDTDKLKSNRQARGQELLNHIKSLPLAVDVNQLNDQGVGLIHIAAANGYKSALKALLRYEPDVNLLDGYGWTPLHVAARFNQMKVAEFLLKKRANPNIKDLLGSKPSAVTSSDELRGLLMKFERRHDKAKDKEELPQPVYMEFEGEGENVYSEISEADEPQGNLVGIFRINSKTVRQRHSTISKEDELAEAKTLYETVFEIKEPSSAPPSKGPAEGGEKRVTTFFGIPDDDNDNNNEEAEEEEEGDYVSAALWKTGIQEPGTLMSCMDNDNLISLGNIQEDNILKELQSRYSSSQIYTNIGEILIAVNPFKELPFYAKAISMKYHQPVRNTKLPPHIYGTAENAFSNLLRDGMSQCCVISGESGSGKTETCKYIIQHLLRVAGSDEMGLSSKINRVNPLIEAFGNAITVMNNNSSRFGKYVDLSFNTAGKVTGARISEYLLEKSRVVHQGRGERNFHIFYWMMAGLSPEEERVYRLENMKNMRYLKSDSGDITKQTAKENRDKFWELKECLKFIGFSQADIENVFMTLSTVLHLGEISFVGVGNNDAAQVQNADSLKKVSELLEVSPEELGSALIADYTVARGEQIKKERTVQKAEDCRDALAKTLYGRLFSWIVNGINQLIQPVEESNDVQIGILDIFGFENFPQNSFEQLCINVANEQIQLYTNDHIFYKEQQDCLLEGVPLVDLNYATNQKILDLFLEKHTGVLAILDEESNFPKATDKTLATKLHQVSGKKHPEFYKTPKDGGPYFTVVHYAGSVSYDVIGVLEKNRDTLPNGILYNMKTSNRLIIKELFQSRVTRTGSLAPSARQHRVRRVTTKKTASPFEFFKKLRGKQEEKKPQKSQVSERKGPSTMAYHFRNSLSELVAKLQSASPHFVRCLKPNPAKTAMEFDTHYILAQLRYTGISDIVKIRKFGYAMRLTFYEFLQRYHVLVKCCLPQFCPISDDNKCKLILQKYRVLDDVQFGKTKMFFNRTAMDRLDYVTRESQRKVTTAQSVIRGFLARQQSKKMALLQEKSHKDIASLTDTVGELSIVLEMNLRQYCREDEEQFQLSLKKEQIAEITKSLESLDDVIDTYAEIKHLQDTEKTETHLDDDDNVGKDLYDDAFSVQAARDTELKTTDEPDMNGHYPAGMPQSPTHFPSGAPPCPREMYGYSAIYDEQLHQDYRRAPPPPPTRAPDTRLSSASVGSTSSATYDDISVEDQFSQYHQYPPSHQSPHHAQSHQSPHRTTNGSPQMKSKFPHEPQSPGHPQSAGQRPFSYGANIMSPKLKHVDANGQARQSYPNVPQNPSEQYYPPNVQYNEMSSASPAVSYGRHESAFSPQHKHPAPASPPPPPPPSVYMQQPPLPPSGRLQNLRMQQRHSVTTLDEGANRQRSPGSPVADRRERFSKRSKSVPMHPDEEINLPSPPPPVSVKDSYLAVAVATNRPPSPPLPPPPPELMLPMRNDPPPPPPPTNMPYNQNQTSYNQQVQYERQQAATVYPGGGNQAPPPPPVASIPKRSHEPETRPPPSQPKGSNSVLPSNKEMGRAKRDQSPGMLDELGRVQLKKTGDSIYINGTKDTNDVQLNGDQNLPFGGFKLRSTPGVKLWATASSGLKEAPREPSPPPPPVPEPVADLPPPPPPTEQTQEPPAQQTKALPSVVSMFEKKAEQIAKTDNKRNKGDTSDISKMEYDLNNIDLNDVPGYTPVTKSTPVWKREMIEKKNQEKIEEYIAKKEREKAEAEKWKHVPAWKRKLMEEKEKEKKEKDHEAYQKKPYVVTPHLNRLVETVQMRSHNALEEQAEKKRKEKEQEEQRKARIREQQEMERQMEEELKNVPAWKKEIMMKRGGAIKNWGDEREDINEQEREENERIARNLENENDNESNNTYVQSTRVVLQKQSKNIENNQYEKPVKHIVEEPKIEDEWDSLPAWKKEIMMKRGGAPTNWGDEREEVNDED